MSDRGSTREPPTWTGYQGGDGACSTCADVGRRGYCAPARCYCGHEECPAFASWKPSCAPSVINIKPADERMAKSWADREEPTWLDR